MIRSQRSPTGCGNGSRSAPAAAGNSSASTALGGEGGGGGGGGGGSGATATTGGGGGAVTTGSGATVAQEASSTATAVRKGVVSAIRDPVVRAASIAHVAPRRWPMVGPMSRERQPRRRNATRAATGTRSSTPATRRTSPRRRAGLSSLPRRSGPHGRHAGPQEWIGGPLERDRRRQRGFAALAAFARSCAILAITSDWPVRPPMRSEGSPACTRGRNRPWWRRASARSAPSDAHICAGVPSNRRPHPAANSVSPQNTQGCPPTSPNSATWPAVWPGMSRVRNVTRQAGHRERVAFDQRMRAPGDRLAAGPYTGTRSRASSAGIPPTWSPW